MAHNKTFAAGALLLLAAVVPAVAYHIDPYPAVAGLTPGDWTFTLGSVVILCESNGPLDDRNDNPTANPGTGGPCTTGESDSVGRNGLAPGVGWPGSNDDADEPAAGTWTRIDACARDITTRGLNPGDLRLTAVTFGTGTYTASPPAAQRGDTDEGRAVTAAELGTTDPVDGLVPVQDGDDQPYTDVDGDETVSAGDFRHGTLVPDGIGGFLPTGAVGALDADVTTAFLYEESVGDAAGVPDAVMQADVAPAGASASDDFYYDMDGTDSVSGANNFVWGGCSDGNALNGVETDQHTWTARLGAFQCVIPTIAASQVGVTEDYAFYYESLYAWYSYDGDGDYTGGDDVGPHTGDTFASNVVDNEDGFQGHVTGFLSTTAADHRAATAGAFSTQGSMEVVHVTALPARSDAAATSNGGVSNACGASPSTDEDGGAGDPAGPVFRAPNDCAGC